MKVIFPGYVCVKMDVTDDSWFMVRNTSNVTGFVDQNNSSSSFSRRMANC